MTDNGNALDLFVAASNRVRELDIPSRDAVEALAHSAMRMVAMDLANNNIAGAIDTLDKTRAVEEYIKAKVRQEHSDLVTQNLVAACRFRIMRDVGGWLKRHLPENWQHKSKSVTADGSPKYGEGIFWREDLKPLGLDKHKIRQWQHFATPPNNEFESFLSQYIKPDNGTVDELIFKHVWSFANPKPPTEEKKEQIIPEVIVSAPGKKFFLWLKDGKQITTDYFDYLRTEAAPMSEIIFLVEYLEKTWKNLASAWKQLRRVTGVKDVASGS